MFKKENLNLTQKVAYNAAFSSTSRLLEMVIAFLIIKLNAGYLNVSGFGDYGTILAFVYIFSVLADFGLYSITVRDISSADADEAKIINNAFTMRLILGLVIFTSAYFASFLFPYSNDVKLGVLIASFGYWLMSCTQVLMGLFQKHLIMDKVSVASLSARMAQLLAVFLCVRYDLGFLWIVGTICVGAFFDFFIVLFFARKLIRIRLDFDFVFWKDMLRRAFPLAVSAILVLIYFKLDTIFLSVMKGSEAVGIYSLAYRIMESLTCFASIVVGLTMPLMSRAASDDIKKFKSISQRTLDFLLVAICAIIFGTFAISDKIILTLSKSEFQDSSLVLQILVVALGFIFLGALFSNMIIALKKQKYLAYIYFIGAFFNIVANLVYIPEYSYFGASGTTLATEFLVTVLMLWVIYKEIDFIPSFKRMAIGIFAGYLMLIALRWFDFLGLFSSVALGGIVYMFFIYVMGGISKAEMEKLFQKKI
ncbi:MAG: flippase [Candidatus Pacebacteria bacterium]|nr:flippase [Candidatus Paceibacterota bacterium]